MQVRQIQVAFRKTRANMKSKTLRSHSKKSSILAITFVVIAIAASNLLGAANTAPSPVSKPVQEILLTVQSSELTEGPDGSLFGSVSTDASAPPGSGAGAIFRVALNGQSVQLHVFDGKGGAAPSGRLLYASDGYLYGVTKEGGGSGFGTIYRVLPDGSGFQVIHDFDGEDGGAPLAGLIQGPDGILYGTASKGAGGDGTVFSASPTGQFSILHTFSGTGGSAPFASLLLGRDGLLYGTTGNGGAGSKGEVFRLAPNGKGFEVVHSFTGPDGAHPEAALVRIADGSLVGVTTGGAGTKDGVLFRMSADGSEFTVMHSFTGYNIADPIASDGAHPTGLYNINDGYVYGVTLSGGARDVGTVFRADPVTGQVNVLFSYRNGSETPQAGLVVIGGALYLPVHKGKTLTLRPVASSVSLAGIVTPQATDTVTTTADSGAGSLRAVIAAAASGDTIAFNASLSGKTITLTSGEILINKNLTITGPGSANLTITGNGASRIFFMNGGTVSVSGLTISDGVALGGGGGAGNDGGGGGGAGMGGGMFVNAGSLTLTDVNFSQCSATGGTGGVLEFDSALGGGGGGGIAPGAAGNGGAANSSNQIDGGAGGSGGELGGTGGTGGTATSLNGGNGGPGAGGGGGAWNSNGIPSGNGGSGGFGGGGGGGANGFTSGPGSNGGAAGFGGGGGGAGFPNGVPGAAGMFGGAGQTNTGAGTSGDGGGGAGLGGALFVNSGVNLVINSGVYSNNTSTGGDFGGFQNNPGQGKGGAIFINTSVTGSISSITYNGNTATDAGTTSFDNNNIYGAFACTAATPSITAPSSVCPNSTGNTASGPAGESSYSWTITGGTITAGATSQTVTFTAGASGTVALTLNIVDTNGCTASNSANVSIGGAGVTVGPSTVPAGTAGVAYTSTQFTPTGSTFTITSGTLPTGMSFSTSGLLSGTPTQTGSFPITVTATPSTGCPGSVSVTLTINCPTITVSPSTVPSGTAGTAYTSTQFTQTGGIGTVTFSRTGTLPTGMTFTSAGVLSGTPTKTGSFPLTIKATDSNGCTGTVGVTLTINCQTITVTPTTVPTGTAGSAYTSTTFSQTGGIGTTTFSRSGTLPTGMTFNTGTHVLAGTPTKTGSFPITITATDSNGCTGSVNVTIVINCPTITVGPSTIPTGTVGTAYTSTTFTETGGIGTTSIAESGTLPTGMSYSGATHVLSGTPTQSGSFPITITATDSNGCTGSQSYTLVISCPTITVGPSSVPSGTAGVLYTSTTFTQTGGATPITFSETGTLPAGLTLTTAGLLSGTPTKTGSFPIIVTATDAHGCTGSNSYTINIACPTITVGPSSIASGTAGVVYGGATFTQTGGIGAVTFSESGTLPTGITFSSGMLSGTPTKTGSFPITITATDSNGCTGSKSYTLIINCPTITVGPSTIAGATAGATYSGATFTQTGAVGSVTFSESGTLPTGLTFSGGMLSGTPTQTGSFPITITATDSNGCTGTRSYTLTVACPTIVVGPSTIPSGIAGVMYAGASFTQLGGVGSVTFTESGALPLGMTFIGGALSGTPIQTGNFPITVTATDSNNCTGSQAYVLGINCPPITVSPSTVPSGVAGSPYAGASFTQTGGVGTVTFSETGGLPSGLTFSGGQLSGTPTQTGTFPITVTATDSNNCSGSVTFTLTIGCSVITLPPPNIPSGTVDVAYQSTTFTQTGGIGTVTFAESGTLPSGMTFAGGVLSGTPTQSGAFPIAINATDSNNCSASESLIIAIACPGVAIAVSPGTIPAATVGTAYAGVTFSATGGSGNYTLIEAGALPAGITYSNGAISGTPTQTGVFPFTVAATDENGCAGETNYVLTVACVGTTITVSPGSLSEGTTGAAYPNTTFSASGGAEPYSLLFAGALPAGITYLNGVLSGTPTQSGTFQFTVAAADSSGCGGATNYTLVINCPTITVSPGSLPTGTAGSAYSSTTFTQTGGVGTVTFSESGMLPAGLTFTAATATLSGTPTQTGSFAITITATDADGCTGSTSYTITINCGSINVAPSSAASGTAGVAYTPVTFMETGGIGTITFTETGALPTGITLSSAGVLSGTPLQTGSFPITITATDSNGCFGSQSVTLTINCPTITVSPSTVSSGTAGVAYAPATFTQTGGVRTIIFTETGALPNGMTLSSGGMLSGTPTQTGSFPITVKATDGNGCSGTQSVTIMISCPTISVTPATLSAGTAGVAYTPVTFIETGGVGSITFTETGALPNGMTLSSGGMLSGTPTQTGSFPITVKATDSNGCVGTQPATLTIVCPTITVSPSSVPGGTGGVPYAPTTFTQTGGVGTITFTETGALPNGMTLSPGGMLSGTPTQTGSFPITVKATDSNGCFGTQPVTIVIGCPTITVGPASIPNGTAGVVYAGATFSQTGGVGAITFTESGVLPTGLTFAGGMLSGTPLQTGSFPITITATDANGCVGSRGYTLSIACPAITVAPSTVAVGTAGVPYTPVTFTQTGGVGTVTFSESGTLPAGMSFSGGTLSGTPTQTGSFPITVTATDANGCIGPQTLTISVDCQSITVGPDSIPFGTSGAQYPTTTFTQGGAIDGATSTISGALPNGMTFVNGVLSGTPSQAGAFPITVTVTDGNGCTGSRDYVIAVACPSVSIAVSPGVLTAATNGQAYTSTTFSATGGMASYTFAEAGALPSGMTFANGVLSGTPTQSGLFPITVAAVDSTGCAGATNYLLAVACAGTTITVTPGSLIAAVAGVQYTPVNFAVAGGSGPYTYKFAGVLPPGMTYSDGTLSGTPTVTGTYQFTVAALDAGDCAGATNYTLTDNCPTIAVTPGTIPQGTAGVAYAGATFAESGGVGKVTYSESGALPLGMNFSGNQLSGTPLKTGSFPITITAMDSNGCTGKTNYTLMINCPTITVSPSSMPLGTSGAVYPTTTFSQTGGVGSVAFTETGALPAGLSLTSAGVLSGTPMQTGSFPITVTATDSNGCTGSKKLTIQIGCPSIYVGPTIVAQSVQAEAYKAQFIETGGIGSATFSTASNLPSGMSLSSAGLLSGTPTQGGTFAITVTATDSNGCMGSVTVTLNVTALNKCLKDDHNGDFVQFNTTTGDYVFTHCGANGFTLQGKATVTTKSGTIMLTDVESDRNVTIGYLPNQLTGTAVIVLKMAAGLNQTYTVNDTNIHPVCVCGG